MSREKESFYNNFSKKHSKDYIYGNLRVERQIDFLRKAVSRNVFNILIVGCGIGQSAYFLARHISKKAKILAVDISSKNLDIAKKLFNHVNIEYRKLDIIEDKLEGKWEVIVFPDSYEHIPRDSRAALHEKLNKILHERGRILFTVPSPGKQASLREAGEGLQVIDEIVTLEDFILASKDINGTVTYFNLISVWNSNDYIHVIIERGAERIGSISDSVPVFLKRGAAKKCFICNLLNSFFHKLLVRFRKRRYSRMIEKVS